MNKNSKSAQILWKSITEGGFLAGIFLIGFRAIGLNELLTFLAYLLTLFVLTLTAFNIRLYNIRKDTKPSIDYVDGHEQSMKWLSKYIREATQSVWVTRFSKGFISDDSDYFKLTDRKIKGEKCSPIYVYKRLIKLDTYEKIEYTASLIQKYGVNKNFFLKYCNSSLPFEIVIVDEKIAFMMFHERDGSRTINAGLKITDREVVSEFIEIYTGLWESQESHFLQNGSLSEQRKQKSLKTLEELSQNVINFEDIDKK